MIDFKMKVVPEQSRVVQEICFAHGGGWRWSGVGSNKVVSDTDKLYLFSHKGSLTCSVCEEVFISSLNKEIQYLDFIDMYKQECLDVLRNKMDNFKVKVTPEQSGALQEVYFAHEGEWSGWGSNKVVSDTDKPYLFSHKGSLTCSVCEEAFVGSLNKEIQYSEFMDIHNAFNRNNKKDEYMNDNKIVRELVLDQHLLVDAVLLHNAVIKEWMSGSNIQKLSNDGVWENDDEPSFSIYRTYRVEPEALVVKISIVAEVTLEAQAGDTREEAIQRCKDSFHGHMQDPEYFDDYDLRSAVIVNNK